MNEEYFKEQKKRGMEIISRQRKMSLAEMRAQTDKVLGSTNQNGNPYQEKNLKPQETENPEA